MRIQIFCILQLESLQFRLRVMGNIGTSFQITVSPHWRFRSTPDGTRIQKVTRITCRGGIVYIEIGSFTTSVSVYVNNISMQMYAGD